jgi:dolichol-phosphate mannosyltransferase
MKLSIIVPVYNERNTIQEILRRVRAVDIGEIAKEIIVVDDGSTDGTMDILKLEEDSTTARGPR